MPITTPSDSPLIRGRENSIIIHYGEIGLKGKNRPEFEDQLKRNIELKLKSAGFDLKVRKEHGYLTIEGIEGVEGSEGIEEAFKSVPGIVWFAFAEMLPVTSHESPDKTISEVETKLLELANSFYEPNKTFAVRAHRADKSFALSSKELEIRLGKLIQDKTKWQGVNLDGPDETFYIDIYSGQIFIYSNKHHGLGGLPVGTAGRVLSLLSGGIDSPVASYLMAKRGCEVDFIHFTATPMQQKDAGQYKVSRLVEELSRITLKSKLYLVPYTNYQLAVGAREVSYDLILFRRFMARAAERLANKINSSHYEFSSESKQTLKQVQGDKREPIQALVTGDNLAQVASQTLPNLVSTSQAVKLPILRPLLGYDKQEIIRLAEQIGTYELSLEPYKDCCSIISQKPKTRSKDEKLAELEAELFSGYEKLIDDTLGERVGLEFLDGRLVG